jgi:small GTP-binding protein
MSPTNKAETTIVRSVCPQSSQMHSKTFDYSVKTIIVGDSSVGKTCLLQRYVRDRFEPESQPTLGVEFMSRIEKLGSKRIELQLWDTAGQELFRSVTRCYYRGAIGAFIVFDIASSSSFDSVPRWFHDILESANSEIVLVLLGNKSDLTASRQIQKSSAEEFANKNKMTYFETSGRTGENVAEAMRFMLEKTVELVDGGYRGGDQGNGTYVLQDEAPGAIQCC